VEIRIDLHLQREGGEEEKRWERENEKRDHSSQHNTQTELTIERESGFIHQNLPSIELLLSLRDPELSLSNLFHEFIQLIRLLIQILSFSLTEEVQVQRRGSEIGKREGRGETERGRQGEREREREERKREQTRMSSLLPPLLTICSLLSFHCSR
jgi:hypothetical protein